MIRMNRFALLTLSAILLLQAPAFAQGFKGRVTATGKDSFQMTTPDPDTREILVVAISTDAATQFEGVSSLEELKVGNPVKVEAVAGQGGKWQATFVGAGY